MSSATGEKSDAWDGIPRPADGWKWEFNKGVLFQKETPKGYATQHVLSSLEKAIMEGNVEQSLFWATEYNKMGTCFVASFWTALTHILINSIGLANVKLINYFEYQHEMFKAFMPVSSTTTKKSSKSKKKESTTAGDAGVEDKTEKDKTEKDKTEKSSSTLANAPIPEHCFKIILETVRQMALSPKSRLVDSAARTFFMPYPKSTHRRPFEPHIHFQRAPSKLLTQRPASSNNDAEEGEEMETDQAGKVNLYDRLRKLSHAATWIPSASFVDDCAEEERETHYSLYQLQEDDPTYLKQPCNAFVYQLNCLDDLLKANTTSSGRDVIDWNTYEQIERGALYYAGIIFQCTEPCVQRYHRHDSVNIIWEILHDHAAKTDYEKTGLMTDLLKVFHNMSNKFRNAKSTRERSFVSFALLVYLRRFWLEDCSYESLKQLDESQSPLNLNQVFAYYNQNTLPVLPSALDYTTKEGLAQEKRIQHYLRWMANASKEPNDNRNLIRNEYYEWSILFQDKRAEECRDKKGYQDVDKTLEPLVSYFKMTAKNFDDFDVSTINTLPLEWFLSPAKDETKDRTKDQTKDQGNGKSLTWRGEFIPYQVTSSLYNRTKAHPFAETFSNVSCIETPNWREGVFVGTYQHPLFEPVDVFFVTCSFPQQAFYQCFLDELKPIFGVPKLGTHSLVMDRELVKLDKQISWSNDNWTIGEKEAVQHVVMFPISSLGFKSVKDVGANFSYSVVDILCQPVERKNKAPFYEHDNVLLKHQVLNVFMFYLCMDIPYMTLNHMFMKDVDNDTFVFVKSALERDVKNDEAAEKVQAEGGQGKAHKERCYTMTVDEKVAVANALVVPFCELSAFSNCNFPDTFKRIKNTTLMRTLFIESDKYFMIRFFDVLMNLNTEALESIIQRFGGPVLEWSSAIRSNLRDARSGWLLWRDHTERVHFEKKTKSLEKMRERKERAQAKKALLQSETKEKEDDVDEGAKTTKGKPTKKKAPSKKVTREEMEGDKGGDLVMKQLAEGIKVNVKGSEKVKRRRVEEPAAAGDAQKE
jgi:hypothetical protein